MSGPRVVTVLFGAGVDSGQHTALDTERSLLERLFIEHGDQLDVRVISRGMKHSPFPTQTHVDLGDVDPGPTDRMLAFLGASSLRARLATFPLGRLLNSMGPLDPGRAFWRAVRRSPEAKSAIRGSDMVLAADLGGVRTAWTALRRGWVAEAHYDHRASGLRR